MKPLITLTMLAAGLPPAWIGLVGCGPLISTALATEYPVSSAADIARITEGLRPGDTLVMAQGVWQDQAIAFRGQGTEAQPVILRAETPGKVVLAGNSSLNIAGEHLTVSGIFLKDGQSRGDGVRLAGHGCRLTESAVSGGAGKFMVHIFGSENRVDHCYFAGKTNDSPTMQIEVEGKPNFHRIDHNHFGPRPPLGRNGGETIRVGYSHQSMTNSGTLVERNLFERCDGEIEIISNKSCENVYRYNTFLECAGMLTLRHGNRCVVEANFFLGHHKRGSGGIRVIGEDHVVINNYIEGVEQGGIWITAGIPDSPLAGYYQARNCLIAFNTVVDSRGPCVELAAGFGSARRSLRPENITIANNVFVPAPGEMLLKGEEGERFTWLGNLAWNTAAIVHRGIRRVDPKLERGKDGLSRPTAESPVRGAAEGEFPAVRADIDGQARTGRLDAGCDQVRESPAVNGPLTNTAAGPAWRK